MVLLFVYLMQSKKTRVLACVCLVLFPVIDLVFAFLYSGGQTLHIFAFAFGNFIGTNISGFIDCLLLIFLVVMSLIKYSKKWIDITITSVFILSIIMIIINVFLLISQFTEYITGMVLVNLIISFICDITGLFALCVFMLLYKRHFVLIKETDSANNINVSTKEQLLVLKRKFEAGVLSEEEYQEERQKVINNI